MAKAILVMDMPSSCFNCQLCVASRESSTGQLCWKCMVYPTFMIPKRKVGVRQGFCPLHEIPKQKVEWYDDERSNYEQGYNACIDEILGGGE